MKRKKTTLITTMLLLPLLPFVIRGDVMSYAMYMAVDHKYGDLPRPSVQFLAEYGDRYFAYHLIEYMKKMDGDSMSHGHEKAVARLAERFPDEADGYKAYVAASILDPKVDSFSRAHLVNTAMYLSGNSFGIHRMSDESGAPKGAYWIAEGQLREIVDWRADEERARAKEAAGKAAAPRDAKRGREGL